MQKAPVFQRQLSFPVRYCWSRTSPVCDHWEGPSGAAWGETAAAPLELRWSWGLRCAEPAPTSLAHQARMDHQSHRDSKVSHPGAGTTWEPPASPVSPAHLTPELLLLGTKPRLPGVPALLWSVPMWIVKIQITLSRILQQKSSFSTETSGKSRTYVG